MTRFFTGSVEGKNFIAAHDLSTKRTGAAIVLDAMTTLHGANVPNFNQYGWLVRPLPADPTHLIRTQEVLSQVGQVEELPPVTREAMAQYLGEAGTKAFFKQAESMYPEPTVTTAPLPEEQ